MFKSEPTLLIVTLALSGAADGLGHVGRRQLVAASPAPGDFLYGAQTPKAPRGSVLAATCRPLGL